MASSARPFASEDVADTMQLIKNYWPDLQRTTDELLKCEPNFIARFFKAFLVDLNEQLSDLTNEEDIIADEFDEIQDFEETVRVYCKVARLLKKLNEVQLYFADFYIANVKKMYLNVKFSIHFVIFINNLSEEVAKIVNVTLNKMMDNQTFKTLKQQHLQNTAENAEHSAALGDLYETYKVKLEEEKIIHEKTTNDKIIEEKKTVEKTQEASVLQNDSDNLEYELKMLDDMENDLKESLVTESDIETLRKTENYLEAESQLCDDHVEENISEQSEKVERLKEHAKQLRNLNFDSLDLETRLNHKQQLKQRQTIHENANKQLNELNNNIVAKSKQVEAVQAELQKTRLLVTEVKNKISLEERMDLKTRAEETGRLAVNFEACQKIQTDISMLQDALEKIKDDGRQLEAASAKQYKRYLEKDKIVTNQFYMTLFNLSKLSTKKR